MNTMSRLLALTLALSASHLAAADGAAKYVAPRAIDGKPSLEGVWTNATITTLQRPGKFKSLIIPPGDVEKETNANPQVVRQKDDDKQDSNTTYNGSDLSRGRGYNAFWIDPGMTFNQVRGEYRTSFIIDPADGQIPFKDAGMRRMRIENNDEGAPAGRTGSFDGPEARPLGERCIINSGSAGPPMMTYLYNNNYEFVQTATHFIIRAEMNNYARVVRIGGEHIPKNIRPLHGDSIGRWDGDTLVVETTNFHPFHAQGMIGLSDQAKVTERFTRYSKDQIVYQFTVDDPTRYKQPWSGEYSFNATKDHVYEYACHEGNYALTGTLAGAREQEKRDAEKNKR